MRMLDRSAWHMLAALVCALIVRAGAMATIDATDAADFELVVGLPHSNFAALDAAVWAVSTPSSPRYLSFLQTGEVAALIGASADAIETTRSWLVDKLGARSVRVSPLRDSLVARFSGAQHAARTASALWSARGLPVQSTHPLRFDFVMRRDALSAERPLIKQRRLTRRQSARLRDASVGDIKAAYQMPADLQATNSATLQMVWGPGTFGYSPADLEALAESQCPLLNISQVQFDTQNHGTPGGDNWGEGSLDVSMISTFGLNVRTLVSNTNTSQSTEEGSGFGLAMLDFLTDLAARPVLPHVLSISLGSMSAYSCDFMCDGVGKSANISRADCDAYMQQQRQVCMFLSQDQVKRIHAALAVLATRGVSVLGSSGDGGSHFSFQPFDSDTIGSALNAIACEFQLPVFPTGSPYVLSIGGEDWQDGDSTQPIAWAGSGGGFANEFPQPAYQQATVAAYLQAQANSSIFPTPGTFAAAARAYPDTSAYATDGTSQSCPIFAGLVSMLIDHRLSAGLAPLGLLAPRVYAVAAQHPGEAFQDISSGDTRQGCASGFPAAPGWDAVTGFGRPIWPGMLKYFGSD